MELQEARATIGELTMLVDVLRKNRIGLQVNNRSLVCQIAKEGLPAPLSASSTKAESDGLLQPI